MIVELHCWLQFSALHVKEFLNFLPELSHYLYKCLKYWSSSEYTIIGQCVGNLNSDIKLTINTIRKDEVVVMDYLFKTIPLFADDSVTLGQVMWL